MEKCLFIYNPESGKCKIKDKEDYIVSRLKEKYEVEVVHSQYKGNISDFICEHGDEYSVIVGAGGDGTLSEIVNSIMQLKNRPKLGYIPSGTVNDVAHSLLIPRNTKKAVDNILKGDVFSHDVMKINDRYGIYVCCAGLFTETSYATGQKAKKKMGKLAYLLHGAKGVFNTKAINLKLNYADGEIDGKFAMFLGINSRYAAGMKINKKASLNDGLIDVMLIESKRDRVRLCTVFKSMFLFLRGIEFYINKKHIQHLQLSSLSVKADDSTVINLDGEKICSGDFKLEVVKEGIDIIVPKVHKLQKQIKNID